MNALKKPTADCWLQVRITQEMKEKARKDAQKKGISMSQLVISLIQETEEPQ